MRQELARHFLSEKTNPYHTTSSTVFVPTKTATTCIMPLVMLAAAVLAQVRVKPPNLKKMVFCIGSGTTHQCFN
eukprot:2539363-Amphidinium_carterae.2